MGKQIRYFFSLIFICIVFIYSFSKSSLNLSEVEYNKIKLNVNETYISSIGYNQKKSNILGIQAFMLPADYSTEDRFYNKLEEYLVLAQKNGFLSPQTIVVFPEHIGTPLLLLDEKKEVYLSSDFENVKSNLIYHRYYKYFYHLFFSNFKGNKEIKTLFKIKSKQMRDSYISVFSKLSRFYNVTILAGSIVLAGGEIKNQTIEITSGELKHIAPIFSNGNLVDVHLEKKALLNFEEGYLTPIEPQIESFSFLDIPFKFIVFFSKDSLYNQNYTSKFSLSEIILSPSIFPEKEKILWQDPAISDSIRGDRSLFTEEDKNLSKEELWNKFSIAGKFPYIYALAYMQVFLRGEFFGVKLLGNSSMGYRYIKIETVPPEAKSAILNIYLSK